ncbi:SDR family NAD(P)-dependent oxidoreductase [Bradyrhizobium sp. CB82]|uniref:SDR family NAD(P)-dependent oxidoreductase n=1 Tax=Bradyrhizobium sp. CB82 TaxID=3039159 RepID=UPI0024B140E8|nr:SDR family NAD(P)-dependent oxidoreductase [Bradyrhizobium sp. CB82]WFU37461.1 SDR family NAD(P)-dependent oxidoreductase [Bradyrhizobium sp. CB82]
MLEATGRVVMVSGASRGIGRAVVERLVAGGYRVSAAVRDPRGLVGSDRLKLHHYDAESLPSAEAWIEATIEHFGRLDGLINAAGINPEADLTDPDESALDAMMLINVKAPMRLIRLALPHLAKSGEGRVINIASMSGKRVRNPNVGYAMSKFALLALTHAVRQYGWDHGIRATAICPSFVATDMTAHVTKWPRDKMSDPSDIAELIATVLRLPNTATIAELLVNCRLEDML